MLRGAQGKCSFGKRTQFLGRRWVHMVTEVLPEMETYRRCFRAVALGCGIEVQVLEL